MARSLLFAALLGIASTAAPRLTADGPSLKDVLRRMGAYVQTYGEKASIVVATERYAQHVSGTVAAVPADRVTVADFAIVRAAGFGGWVGFRDVVEADGERITDHTDRLLELLADASGRLDEATRLSNESARFNLGSIARNFNVPTAALFFFRPEYLSRFQFKRKSVDPDGIWELTFEEIDRPTLVRTPQGRSVPSTGTVWVSAADGTVRRTLVHMTEFADGGGAFPRGAGVAQVDVSYMRVPTIGMWLPDTMTESYEVVRGATWDRTRTEARYTNYRQFQTSGRIK